MRYAINELTLTNIANAIRNKNGTNTTMTPAQMVTAINELAVGGGDAQIPPATLPNNHIDSVTQKWVRPVDWPDLDALITDENFEGVYLTYDNRETAALHWASFLCWVSDSSQSWSVERGHVESGVFVVDATLSGTHNVSLQDYYGDSPYDYVVYRVTPPAGEHLVRFFFAQAPLSVTGLHKAVNYYLQCCLERRGNLPYLTTLAANGYTYGYGCATMERDATRVGAQSVVASLASAWAWCHNLQSLDLTGWNTTNWAVTSLASTWASCYSLRELDLSGWNTSNWSVTTMLSCWSGCYALQSLNIGTLNTSNWAVTSLASAWYQCRSLEELDISDWDTSNWAVTTLMNTWNGCCRLRSLDLSDLNTTKWKLTTIAGAWADCYSLTSLDISSIDTSNITSTSGYGSSTYPQLGANMYALTHLAPPQNYKGTCNFMNCISLHPSEIVAFFNNLVATSSSITLSIGAMAARLTQEQAAIATNKGYAIS